MEAQEIKPNNKYLDGLRDDIICFLTANHAEETMLSASGYYIKVNTDELIQILKHNHYENKRRKTQTH